MAIESARPVDAVVIGAGVIGCLSALRLAQAGMAVALVERGEPGAEASAAAAGILGAQMESHGAGPLLELQLASRALHPRLAEELRELTSIDVQCRIEGVLAQAFTDVEVEALRAKRDWQQVAGLRLEWLERESLELQASRAGGVAPGALAALLFPDDGQLDNRLFARALRLAAERVGVSILRAEASAIVARAGRVAGVRLREENGSERLLESPRALLAAGSWSALVPGAQLPLDSVRPVRGQMLVLAARPQSGRVLTGGGGYAVPRRDRYLVGSTLEEAGFHKQVTAAGLRKLLGVAERLLPALRDAEVLDSWSGLRPASRDGLPLIGSLRDGPDGLFVCTGHYRSGILLTPISAELIRDAVLGKPPRFELAPFRPDRF